MIDKVLFNLTSEVIAAWEAEKRRLEAEIGDRQAKLSALNQKLQAAAILTAEIGTPAVESQSATEPDTENMTEAVASIANSSPHPLTPSAIKQRLRALGYPENRLQNYFYTVIARLKAKERIAVMEDGKLWKVAA